MYQISFIAFLLLFVNLIHYHTQEQLNIVAAVTNEQGTRARRRPSVPAQERHPINVVAGASMMRTPELQCMTPLLRFLQLLCENHHNRMQVRICAYTYAYVCMVWSVLLHM